MQQLRGMDAAFLSMESEAVHMHTIKVLIFAGHRAPAVEQIAQSSHSWLAALPSLRRRVVPLPLGLGHPVFVEDQNFDLRRHFSAVTLFPPAGRRQLDELVSKIASVPLERNHPLWQVTLVDGLKDGHWAAVLKVHHALADGTATVAAFSRFFGQDRPRDVAQDRLSGAPQNRSVVREGGLALKPHGILPQPGEPAPSRWRLFQLGLLSLWRNLILLPGLLLQTLRGQRAVTRRRKTGGAAPARVFDTTALSFNREMTAKRLFATAQLPLVRLKKLKDRAGSTLNDVVLAVASGALRRYLLARGELSQKPLIASVPVGLHGQVYYAGNRVSSLFASLPVNLPAADQRLRWVHERMAAAKAELELGQIDSQRWTEILPPVLLSFLVRLARRLRLGQRFRPPINLIFSNVRGPRGPLAAGPYPLTDIYSVGPVLASVGLNITVWSFNRNLNISLLASPDLNPDVTELAGFFEPALVELEKALGREAGATGPAFRCTPSDFAAAAPANASPEPDYTSHKNGTPHNAA